METAHEESKKKELTRTLMLLMLIASMGSFQYGYNLWILNDPVLLRQNLYNMTGQEISQGRNIYYILMGTTVAVVPLGAIFGSILLGILMDKCGRKGTLLLNDLFSVTSVILLSISKHVNMYAFTFFARLAVGICTGIFSTGVPVYLGEVSPFNLRGSIIVMSMSPSFLGVMLAQILGIRSILGNEKGWPILMSLSGMVALLQFPLLFCYPESPRYLLIQKENEAAAREALKMLRGRDDIEDEIEELHQEDLYCEEEKKMTIFKLLFFKDLRWQLFCVIVLMVGQQFSGISAGYFYTDRIFLSTGIGEHNSRYLSAAATLGLIFPYGLTMYAIDSSGRRILLLFGFGVCIISCVLLTMTLELQEVIPWISYSSTVFLLIFLIGYTIGPYLVSFVMITELFLQSSRSSACAIAGSVFWFCNFLLAFTFLHIETLIGPYCFLIFLPFSIASFIYILKVVPETKIKSFLDIRKLIETKEAKRIEVQKQAAKQKARK